MNDEPEDLLVGRLLLLEKENNELRECNKLWQDFCKQYEDVYCEMIDSMPEPILLQEISELINDEHYRSYLLDSASIIERRKMWLTEYQENIKEKGNN